MTEELWLWILGIIITIIVAVPGYFLTKSIQNKKKRSNNKVVQKHNSVTNGDIVGGDKNVRNDDSDR